MNTAIFLTKENKHEMTEAIKALAASQKERINGALVIIHQSIIPTSEAQAIAAPLTSLHATAAAVPCSANLSLPHEAQIAAMFARFCILAYARYPGAWLIMDEPYVPVVENWSQAVSRQHAVHGAKASGLARQDGKTLLSYGPITLQLPAVAIRMWRFATRESWRSRGRYILMGGGFRPVRPEESLFRKLDGDLPAPAPIEEEKPVASTQPVKSFAEFSAPNPEADEPAAATSDEREDLMDQIEKATGKRPHHFTGIEKLRELASNLQPA